MTRLHLAPLALVSLVAFSCDVTLLAVADRAPASTAHLPALASAAPAADPDAALSAAIAEYMASRETGLPRAELELLAGVMVDRARDRGFEPLLVLAVVEVESGFDNFAVSPAGAFGLMQIRPATGEALAARLGIPWQGSPTLFDPIVNVHIGVAYLEELVGRFGDLHTALAAYNWGPGRIDRCLQRGCTPPRSYARRVLAYQESAQGIAGT